MILLVYSDTCTFVRQTCRFADLPLDALHAEQTISGIRVCPVQRVSLTATQGHTHTHAHTVIPISPAASSCSLLAYDVLSCAFLASSFNSNNHLKAQQE